MKILVVILLVTNSITAVCYGQQGNMAKVVWHLFLAGMSLRTLLR